MIRIVTKAPGGQAYEITDRRNSPRSSCAQRFRGDAWLTNNLIKKFALQTDQWLRLITQATGNAPRFTSSHSAEIYDAATQAVLRGDLAIYKLPRLNTATGIRGTNSKNLGLIFLHGPNAHAGTDLEPEAIANTQEAKALLEELGISETLFLRELAHQGLYNSHQQRDPFNQALNMLANGKILAYKIPMPPVVKPPKPVEYEDTSGPKYQPVPMGPPTSEAPTLRHAITDKTEGAKATNQNPELEARHKELEEIGVDLRKNGFTPSTDEEVMEAVNTGDLGNRRFLVSIQKNKNHDEPVGFRRLDTGRTTMWTTTYDMIKNGDLSAPLLMSLLGSSYDPTAEYTMYILDQGENFEEDGAMTFSPTWDNMQKFGPEELHKDNPKDPIRDKALLGSVMNPDSQRYYKQNMEEFWAETQGTKKSEYSKENIDEFLAKKGMTPEEQDQFKARHLYRTQIGANAYFLGNGATEFTLNGSNKSAIANDGIKIKGTPGSLAVPEMLTIEKNPPSINQLETQGLLKAIPLKGPKS